MNMEVKNQILDTAETLFRRYGLRSVTMDDIARELGISKKTLYQHFANKSDLVEQVIRQSIDCERELIEQTVQSAGNALEEMVFLARFVIRQLRELPPTLMYDLQKYYREAWNMLRELHFGYIQQVIENNLRRGMEERIYREDLEPAIIARLYVAKVNNIVDEELFPLSEYDRETLFKQNIQYHIRGIVSPKGGRLFEKLQKKILPEEPV
ncbi:MAG: TetR/AcrR family transcriptional regulator [Bacteroidetes bacterium]|nr:MAG: TetR/AcrR family transcriptional regulator [Bacteroidota bacterium]